MIAGGQEALWNRIRNFQLDDPQAVVKFSDKLASHNHWQRDYTLRVIEEYKKFIFLCCISENGASPSQAVDEVWHLHLTYTQNYWKDFCANVLGQEIHHNPSKGGQQEKHFHSDWYNQTLDLYRRTFNDEPPPDIWPAPVIPNRVTSTFLLPDHEDLPGPVKYLKFFLLLLLPFLVPLLFGKTNPFHLAGTQFLIFYGALIIVSIVCLYIVYSHNKSVVIKIVERYYDQTASVFQLARYTYGRNRAIQAGVVDLVERKVLVPEKRNSFTFSPSDYRYSTDEKNPFVYSLLKQYKENERISYKSIVSAYDPVSTEHPGLSELFNRISKEDLTKYLIAVLVAAIGVVRVIQGMQNNRPVTYLILMMIGTAIAFFFLYRDTSYKIIFRRMFRERFQNDQLGPAFSPSSMLNQFAFMGVSVLGASYLYSNLQNTFQRGYGTGDGGSNYSSCGGSSVSSCGSSDSSCGSSCGGGGGCGGCGGGGD